MRDLIKPKAAAALLREKQGTSNQSDYMSAGHMIWRHRVFVPYVITSSKPSVHDSTAMKILILGKLRGNKGLRELAGL